MKHEAKQIILGTATYFPPLVKMLRRGTGGTDSARYCYSVWLRHLLMADANGLNSHPKIVAELGPGDSLGIGLAALLSGSEQYFAFDVVEFAETERNLKIFDDLVGLFERREAIPGPDEFPEVKPYITDYAFPVHIFSEERLAHSLQPQRLQKIRDALKNVQSAESMIQYKVPWFDRGVLQKGSIDMIYSQAVLEHVDDLQNSYEAMYDWLSPHGFLSHQIDFRCHGTAVDWNGHWAYSDFVWKLIRGNRSFLLNRAPFSEQVRQIEAAGFKIVCEKRAELPSEITRDQLAGRFRGMTDADLVTGGAFIQAVKAS